MKEFILYNDIFDKSNMTWRMLGSMWIDCKREKWKQSTYQKYRYLLEHYINPQLSVVRLDELSPRIIDMAMFRIYWQDNDKHLSYSLMKCIIFVVNSILKYGSRLRLIEEFRTTFEISDSKNKEVTILSSSDTQNIINYAVVNLSPGSLGILISLYTGLRLGEICALQRRDINFEKNIIHVRKTVQRLRKHESMQGEACEKTSLVITKPKSHKSCRDIPIPLYLVNLLKKAQICELADEIFILGKRDVPYEPRTLQYEYRNILEKNNVKYINFHCLRHTFATNCVKSGFDIKTLSEILGHSSVNFTMNIYVHSDIEQKIRQMNLLNDYMS